MKYLSEALTLIESLEFLNSKASPSPSATHISPQNRLFICDVHFTFNLALEEIPVSKDLPESYTHKFIFIIDMLHSPCDLNINNSSSEFEPAVLAVLVFAVVIFVSLYCLAC